jgi:hypothetical protein
VRTLVRAKEGIKSSRSILFFLFVIDKFVVRTLVRAKKGIKSSRSILFFLFVIDKFVVRTLVRAKEGLAFLIVESVNFAKKAVSSKSNKASE